MNSAALIGQVASEVESRGLDEVRFSLAVLGRADAPADVFTVQVAGARGGACRRYLRIGSRVAVEGRLVSDGGPAIIADRIQFLTTAAQQDGGSV